MANNILIIGNGFDLYHGLPTRYRNFMFFATEWESFYRSYENADKSRKGPRQISVPLDNGDLTHEALAEFGSYPYLFKDEHIEFLRKTLPNNTWIKCFSELDAQEMQWIDFEAEIQNVLVDTEEYSMVSLPKNVGTMGSENLPDRLERIPRIFGDAARNGYLNLGEVIVEEYQVDKRELEKNKLKLIDFMLEELDDLIKCLNYYLSDFVGAIHCGCYSEQVEQLGEVFLLNFNYTTTFHNIYRGHRIREHHAVHGGVANEDIVLGISDDSFPETNDYIRFQKYFQRIQKRTGVFYRYWKITDDDEYGGYYQAHVYILGHSLGLPDFTVLNHFFQNGGVEKVTIFYHDQKAYENLVINLVKALGKDEAVDRIAKEEIEFVKLENAKPVEKLDIAL